MSRGLRHEPYTVLPYTVVTVLLIKYLRRCSTIRRDKFPVTSKVRVEPLMSLPSYTKIEWSRSEWIVHNVKDGAQIQQYTYRPWAKCRKSATFEYASRGTKKFLNNYQHMYFRKKYVVCQSWVFHINEKNQQLASLIYLHEISKYFAVWPDVCQRILLNLCKNFTK
jgi:hypothetical protein